MVKGSSKKGLIKFTPLFVVLPFLMATSPLPPSEPSRTEYHDISVSVTQLGESQRYQGKQEYQLDVENIGEECAFKCIRQANDTRPILSFDVQTNDSIFYEEMVKPSEHFLVNVIASEEDDWSSFNFYSEKLSIFDEAVTYENLSFSFEKSYGMNNYIYELKGKISHTDTRYYYGYIVDVSYLGKEYSLYINPEDGLRTKEELNLDELTINSLKAYRSSYERTNESRITIFYHFLQYGFLYALVLFVGLPVLIIGTILIVKAIQKKKDK